MEKKILLQELSDILAEREGLTKKKADAFVKAFFDVVEEALEADKFVKVKGFGTFKLVAVGDRESINVNTGERIQIGGHSKISFTPDSYLRDLINRPFAHFQTVVLNEETEVEELDSVDRMMEELAEEEAGNVSREEKPEALSMPEQAEQPAVPPVPEMPPLPPLPDEAVPPPLPFEQQDADAVCYTSEERNAPSAPAVSLDEDMENPDGREQERAPATLPDAENAPAHDEAAAASVEAGETTVEPGGDEPDPSEKTYLGEEAEPKPEEAAATTEEPEAAYGESQRHEEETTDDDVQTGSCERKKRRRFLATVAVVVILMAASYFAGYFRLLCPCGGPAMPEKTQTVVLRQPVREPVAVLPRTDSIRTDTASRADSADVGSEPLSRPEKDEKPEDKATHELPADNRQEAKSRPRETTSRPKLREARSGSYIITGTRENYTVRQGETLRSIALRVYGSKSFARYIIQHNSFDNPDNIAAGTVIRLPELRLSTGDTTRHGE